MCHFHHVVAIEELLVKSNIPTLISCQKNSKFRVAFYPQDNNVENVSLPNWIDKVFNTSHVK